MMLVLESEITIGDYRFSGAHEVTIKRSIHSLSELATIKIPAMARVWQNGRAEAELVVAANQFAEGDAVTIRLGYGGELRTEFIGFVKQIMPGTPMTVACEGYGWLLRRNAPGPVGGITELKKLMQLAVSGLEHGYRIHVQCDVDMHIVGVRTEGKCGQEVIEAIRKATDNNITCFFVEPDVLWCGLLHECLANGQLPAAGSSTYKMGANMLHEHKLAVHKRSGRTTIKYAKLKNKAEGYIHGSAGVATAGKTPVVVLQQVGSSKELTRLAQEKIAAGNYEGYQGQFTAFLEPYVQPGMVITLIDDQKIIIAGDYAVEDVVVQFGKDGARRLVTPGRKIR
jgi:hypothetical protein